MSVSKTTYLLAVLVSACLAAPAWADDVATTVAAKLRDSGALTGYRVNVKSKSGTVWLEGRVSDERQLAYIASQMGVPGMPSPVSAIVDKTSGQIVGVLVFGKDGKRYVVNVDQTRTSRLLLSVDTGNRGKPGAVYALQTRYDTINLSNRRQVESIFRVAGWEDALERVQ